MVTRRPGSRPVLDRILTRADGSRVWCALRPYPVTNESVPTSVAATSIHHSRVIVRNVGDWAVSERFTFEGATYAVEGIAELLGRGQYLELRVRTFT